MENNGTMAQFKVRAVRTGLATHRVRLQIGDCTKAITHDLTMDNKLYEKLFDMVKKTIIESNNKEEIPDELIQQARLINLYPLIQEDNKVIEALKIEALKHAKEGDLVAEWDNLLTSAILTILRLQEDFSIALSEVKNYKELLEEV